MNGDKQSRLTEPLATCLIVLAFVVYYLFRGFACPCPSPQKPVLSCARFEVYGWQINHAVFYMFLGMSFPNRFWLWQGLGLLWELVEFVPYVFPSVLPYTGGCMGIDAPPLQLHWLDKAVGLPSPREHFWHVKLTDVILNVVGFAVGATQPWRHFFTA